MVVEINPPFPSAGCLLLLGFYTPGASLSYATFDFASTWSGLTFLLLLSGLPTLWGLNDSAINSSMILAILSLSYDSKFPVAISFPILLDL